MLCEAAQPVHEPSIEVRFTPFLFVYNHLLSISLELSLISLHYNCDAVTLMQTVIRLLVFDVFIPLLELEGSPKNV